MGNWVGLIPGLGVAYSLEGKRWRIMESGQGTLCHWMGIMVSCDDPCYEMARVQVGPGPCLRMAPIYTNLWWGQGLAGLENIAINNRKSHFTH